jgi:queuosine biosynthesis protein QueC
VHPKSLFHIEKFLNQVLGNFKVSNPFCDQTKGQMCAHIAHQSHFQKLAFQTLTCDRLPRVEGRQCGYCTSCLLRRQALLWANIHDETLYGSDQNYFVDDWDIDIRAVLDQIHHLQSVIENPNVFFREYASLNETANYLAAHNGVAVENAKDGLYHLYKQYVSEWEKVELILIDKLGFKAT